MCKTSLWANRNLIERKKEKVALVCSPLNKSVSVVEVKSNQSEPLCQLLAAKNGRYCHNEVDKLVAVSVKAQRLHALLTLIQSKRITIRIYLEKTTRNRLRWNGRWNELRDWCIYKRFSKVRCGHRPKHWVLIYWKSTDGTWHVQRMYSKSGKGMRLQ